MMLFIGGSWRQNWCNQVLQTQERKEQVAGIGDKLTNRDKGWIFV